MKSQKSVSHEFKTEGAEPSVYLNTYSKKFDIGIDSTDAAGNMLKVELIVPMSQAIELAEMIVKRNDEYLESLEEEKESVNDE